MIVSIFDLFCRKFDYSTYHLLEDFEEWDLNLTDEPGPGLKCYLNCLCETFKLVCYRKFLKKKLNIDLNYIFKER